MPWLSKLFALIFCLVSTRCVEIDLNEQAFKVTAEDEGCCDASVVYSHPMLSRVSPTLVTVEKTSGSTQHSFFVYASFTLRNSEAKVEVSLQSNVLNTIRQSVSDYLSSYYQIPQDSLVLHLDSGAAIDKSARFIDLLSSVSDAFVVCFDWQLSLCGVGIPPAVDSLFTTYAAIKSNFNQKIVLINKETRQEASDLTAPLWKLIHQENFSLCQSFLVRFYNYQLQPIFVGSFFTPDLTDDEGRVLQTIRSAVMAEFPNLPAIYQSQVQVQLELAAASPTVVSVLFPLHNVSIDLSVGAVLLKNALSFDLMGKAALLVDLIREKCAPCSIHSARIKSRDLSAELHHIPPPSSPFHEAAVSELKPVSVLSLFLPKIGEAKSATVDVDCFFPIFNRESKCIARFPIFLPLSIAKALLCAKYRNREGCLEPSSEHKFADFRTTYTFSLSCAKSPKENFFLGTRSLRLSTWRDLKVPKAVSELLSNFGAFISSSSITSLQSHGSQERLVQILGEVACYKTIPFISGKDFESLKVCAALAKSRFSGSGIFLPLESDAVFIGWCSGEVPDFQAFPVTAQHTFFIQEEKVSVGVFLLSLDGARFSFYFPKGDVKFYPRLFEFDWAADWLSSVVGKRWTGHFNLALDLGSEIIGKLNFDFACGKLLQILGIRTADGASSSAILSAFHFLKIPFTSSTRYLALSRWIGSRIEFPIWRMYVNTTMNKLARVLQLPRKLVSRFVFSQISNKSFSTCDRFYIFNPRFFDPTQISSHQSTFSTAENSFVTQLPLLLATIQNNGVALAIQDERLLSLLRSFRDFLFINHVPNFTDYTETLGCILTAKIFQFFGLEPIALSLAERVLGGLLKGVGSASSAITYKKRATGMLIARVLCVQIRAFLSGATQPPLLAQLKEFKRSFRTLVGRKTIIRSGDFGAK